MSCAVLLLGLSFLVAAGPRETGWKAVDDAINQGLPKTAIEQLEPIIKASIEEQKFAEAIKAISLKISLEGTIEGNKPEEKITRMRAEIERAPDQMKPVMEAVIANWFWHYFQQNRWRFLQRTQSSAPPSEDFTTWDLPQILSEIDRQFDQVLSHAETLKKIPVGDYDDLFERGTAPDTYRPTLFDVLAHNALEFYMSGEQAGSRKQDAFDLSAEDPIFAPTDQFVAWRPTSTDNESFKAKAVALYQQLIEFHRGDEDASALLDADLLRLKFGYNAAFGEEKATRYQAALKRFVQENASHVISTRARHLLATTLHGEGDLVEAHRIATEGLNRFPESVGGQRCFNLIQQIESRSARVTTERVWNDPRPTIDVHYRNVSQVHFRIVRFEFMDLIRNGRWQAEQMNHNQRKALLSSPSVKSWSVDLPKTVDYQERLEQVPSPDGLPAGSYFLIASHRADFREQDNQISFTEIWESDLAVVARNHQNQGLIDGFVLDANSGSPIAGARVKIWQRGNRNQLVAMPDVTTDQAGLFRFKGTDHRQHLILASHKGQSLSSISYLRPYLNSPAKANTQTRFFTDRSIYRPGQTIRYKGISIAVDHSKDNYHTLPRAAVTVVFSDVNGKVIEQIEHRTNDYGSFSGSVTAPRDRLLGRMSLRVLDGPQGSTSITVEEYKRPKFQVEISPPEEAAKLRGTVELKGKATAYTGAAINDAKVSWRVVRQVQYPSWWYWRCWWMPPRGNDSQEIAHGTARTNANGTFEIAFDAKPDPSVLEASEPTFRYVVNADVTDTNGETRSAQQQVKVGYTALAASMSVGRWLTDENPVEVEIRTTTLDGEGLKANGTLQVHVVEQPATVTRKSLSGPRYGQRVGENPKPDPTNPNSWPLGEVVLEQPFETGADGRLTVPAKLAGGMYRASLVTQDRFGKQVTAEVPIQVLSPTAKRLNLKLPNVYANPKASIEPGQQYTAVWGSGYDAARAYIEVEHRGRLIQSFWSDPNTTQVQIKQRVDEAMRGGFRVRTTMVRENRAYMQSHYISVPWTNKQLSLKWEHIVSKLEPAVKETWTAVISGPDAEMHVAEMVAGMYDASLDAYLPHSWASAFNVFRQDRSRVESYFENRSKNLQNIFRDWRVASRDGRLTYRRFPRRILQNLRRYQFQEKNTRQFRSSAIADAEFSEEGFSDMSAPMAAGLALSAVPAAPGASGNKAKKSMVSTPTPDLTVVSARKNLNETAFFFPHLISGKDGIVRLEFTMPEALTEWKFLGFAHDNDLRAGLLTGSTVTSKDLMVQPNPPRFLREGDMIEFTVKISNQSPTRQTGTVRLTFADARTNESVDDALKNIDRDKSFEIPAGESESLAWKLSVPDGLGFLTYKAVGSTGKLSDGEEGMLPVLSKRILVTESLPLPIRGKQTKKFEFTKLLESDKSDSLQHQSLTVQMVSNPSWYAVMSLPYLMEYPHQCAEQTFNRFYANAIAKHIADSDPKIQRVFQQWRGTPALDSPLEKNQELKAVQLEETPWVRQAESESQARRNVGILFEDNRLNDEVSRAAQQLSQMQLANGAWPWFPGGPANDYITLYITTGFGRMRHLGVQVEPTAAIKSLNRLDAWATKRYQTIKPTDRGLNHLDTSIALYLYGRSFFLRDQPVAPQHTEAIQYWLNQSQTHWLGLSYRQSQAHLAIALKRFDRIDSAKAIMKSIKERSVSNEEMGMFWRDTELSWWWYRAPIETQAMMIEAFDEVMNDQQAVEDCKVWLLKQKQTQDWKTTKATADAVYALLLRGSDVLASDALVEVALAGATIQPDQVESGTGFFEQRFAGAEIVSKQGEITVKKSDDGVAWGSVHWQYLEDMSRISPYDGTPLKLEKRLFVKKNTGKGPTLDAVDGPLGVGDELVVRVILRTDRDMEYVHLKDYRGSGTEPVNVLSKYKYQDGLGYYETTRDTASHFFIDYLPKGTYVFEYSTRVQLRGKYQTGVASIQSMYAPEFNSHSRSLPIEVK
ncbi:MAG: alpha-2-macroglobulin [Rubripirellula sp.]